MNILNLKEAFIVGINGQMVLERVQKASDCVAYVASKVYIECEILYRQCYLYSTQKNSLQLSFHNYYERCS